MKRLSAFSLKLIALLAMTIDHTALVFFPGALWMRFIGRIAMPIFSFLLAESYRKTRNRVRFLRRLLLFALVAQVPFMLIVQSARGNVLVTMALAVVCLMCLDGTITGVKSGLLLVGALLASAFCDWQVYGILFVIAFYLGNGEFRRQAAYFSGAAGVYLLVSILEGGLGSLYPRIGVFLALPFLALYSGERGRDLRYLFYLYYPLHLLILYGLTFVIA